VAVADFVGSATLVAFTVTVWELVIEVGAVYRPAALMLPTSGLTDHATPVLAVPLTVAVNCWFCEAVSEVVEGVSKIVTGMRLMVELADLVGSAVLVAFTVTLCALAIEAGAE
jgi:hypothetical protein